MFRRNMNQFFMLELNHIYKTLDEIEEELDMLIIDMAELKEILNK